MTRFTLAKPAALFPFELSRSKDSILRHPGLLDLLPIFGTFRWCRELAAGRSCRRLSRNQLVIIVKVVLTCSFLASPF